MFLKIMLQNSDSFQKWIAYLYLNKQLLSENICWWSCKSSIGTLKTVTCNDGIAVLTRGCFVCLLSYRVKMEWLVLCVCFLFCGLSQSKPHGFKDGKAIDPEVNMNIVSIKKKKHMEIWKRYFIWRYFTKFAGEPEPNKDGIIAWFYGLIFVFNNVILCKSAISSLQIHKKR